MILLHDADGLLLRAMGGTAAWIGMSNLIDATRGQVFRLVAASQQATYLAAKLLPRRDADYRVVRFKPWSDEQIGRRTRPAYCTPMNKRCGRRCGG